MRHPLIDALEPIKNKIDLAFVYGSVAKATDTSGSDIDLMIVSGELASNEVFIVLAPMEIQLGRQVNLTLYSRQEFSDKGKMKKGFLAKVLNGPVIELIGSIDG